MWKTCRFSHVNVLLPVTFFLILCGVFSVNTWAAPVAPVEFELSQPDGTTFTAIQRGDEYVHWIETIDGHTIVRIDNAWHYAELDGAGRLKAARDVVGSLSHAQLRSMPLHLSPARDSRALERRELENVQLQGAALPHTQNVLTILVDYTDITFAYGDAEFDTAIHGTTESAKSYFLENSYNKFTIAPATETFGAANDGIVHVAQSKNHPNTGALPNVMPDFARNTADKAEASEAVSLADPFVDYSSYDANSDGNVSAEELSIVIILAGYEGGYDGAAVPRVYGHKASFASLTLDGVTLSPYTMFGERHGSGIGHHRATLGIINHELGHLMLGLPDLYTGVPSAGGVGVWGLMGAGTWLSSVPGALRGDSPGPLSAWSKVVMGFTTPQDIDTDQSGLSIAAIETNEDAKRLWIDKYKLNEYFLIENRQGAHYFPDGTASGDGLLIWHVEDALTKRDQCGAGNCLDLEAAQGDAELDAQQGTGYSGNNGGPKNPYPGSSNKTAFDDASTPNSRDRSGAVTGIGVTNISASGPTMTADIAALTGGVGDHVRYDSRHTSDAAFNGTGAFGIKTTNDTSQTRFDGVEVYILDPAGAQVTVYICPGIASDGTEIGPCYSEVHPVSEAGWNRVLFGTPQDFPQGAERFISVFVDNNGSEQRVIPFDNSGTPSNRSYYDEDDVSPWTKLCEDAARPWLCGDVNLVALLSTPDDVCVPDAFESDNSLGEAKGVFEWLPKDHSICPEGDEDWSAFAMADEANVVLTTSGPLRNAQDQLTDTVMTLYNDAEVEVDKSDDVNVATNRYSRIERACGVNPLPAGDYYVKVNGYSTQDEIAAYALELDFEYCNTCALRWDLDGSISGTKTYRAEFDVRIGKVGSLAPDLGAATVNGTYVAVRAPFVIIGNDTQIGGTFVAGNEPGCGP